MNCQNCGAPMKFDHEKIYFSCEYCISIFFPEESSDGIRSTDEPSYISCPVCKLPLVLAYAEKIKLYHCMKCRGVLINQQNFLQVIRFIRSRVKGPFTMPPPLSREELSRNVVCPQCHQKMDTHPYGGPGNIVIDNCPRCMLNWLDHNELYRITHSPERSDRGRIRAEDDERLFRVRKKYRD